MILHQIWLEDQTEHEDVFLKTADLLDTFQSWLKGDSNARGYVYQDANSPEKHTAIPFDKVVKMVVYYNPELEGEYRRTAEAVRR
jgi:hypothetical protein